MRVFPRTLGITALLLTPAFHAAMAQEPAPAALEPPPATSTAPAAAPASNPMSAGTGAFGSVGQLAVSVDLPMTNEAPQFAIYHHSVSMGGPSITAINIQPSLDYFVAPNISVGGQIGVQHGSADLFGGSGNDTATAFGLELRGGYNLALNDMFSIWPHLGIAYEHVSISGGGTSATGYLIPLLVTVPVLWHPASHFFIGLAPTLRTDLVAKLEGMNIGKTTDVGLTAVIGGYFGGT
ncbi:MAG: hypothetical protein ACJ8F1_08150 [Polyangia bacterium]|jgi:opacity protein-like surface antigen